MGILDKVITSIKKFTERASESEGLTKVLLTAHTAALGTLTYTIKKYYSKTEERIREIYEFLGEVEDKNNLTTSELKKLKLMVNDLMNEVNDKTLASLMGNLSPAKKVKIVEHFVNLKKSYHVILSTVMIELNKVLEEEGSEIRENLNELKTGIETDTKSLKENQKNLIEIMDTVQKDVSKISELYSDLDDIKRKVQVFRKDLEELGNTTNSVLSNVHRTNDALNRSRASAILLLIAGALIGLLGNLVAQTVSIPSTISIITLIIVILIFFFVYIRRRLDL